MNCAIYDDRLLSSSIGFKPKLGETFLQYLSYLHCTVQGLKYWSQ